MEKRVLKFFNGIIIAAFSLVIILALYMGTYGGNTALTSFIYSLILCFIGFKARHYILESIKTKREIICILTLSLICFAAKYIWVANIEMEPKVDYATFYYYAVELSEMWSAESRYVALFPHIFGYSSFLSIFIKIFGASYSVAPMLNVFLSVISGIMLYKIAKNLISPAAAFMSYLLWILCPSQTFYNSLAFSDLLYTTILLGFILLIIEVNKKYSGGEKRLAVYIATGLLCGVVLRSINVCRPIAMILIIALFIWIFLLRFQELKNKNYIKVWISFFLSATVIYFATGFMWNAYFESRVGEAPASAPGYNIYVGFNDESSGVWNEEDSELLFSYSDKEGATAQLAQESMLIHAKERILSGDIDFWSLLKRKIKVFLGSDTSAVGYNTTALDKLENLDINHLNVVSNTFYYSVLILSLIGGYNALRQTAKTTTPIILLYVIGLTAAQMLVEVAGRYHYSLIPMFILISQFAFCNCSNKEIKEEKNG